MSDLEGLLPAGDCDLETLKSQIVQAPKTPPDGFEKRSAQQRSAEFQAIFEGQSELTRLHALLIAILRRRAAPPEAQALFMRIWREQGKWLADHLEIRWRISAATTFADCGESADQRALGMGLSVLFDTVKLYESERRVSGHAPETPFEKADGYQRLGMAFDMQPYALARGDLDKNLLARLWKLAERDDVMFPLARSMLFEVMTDKRSVFARLQQFKEIPTGSDDDP